MRPPSDRIILPERGLTLLPPWPQAIVFADKRLENRGASIAGRIGTWRGMVALTQSKVWSKDALRDAFDISIDRGLATLSQLGDAPGGMERDGGIWKQWAGKLVAVAELMDVLPPDRCEGEPWLFSNSYLDKLKQENARLSAKLKELRFRMEGLEK